MRDPALTCTHALAQKVSSQRFLFTLAFNIYQRAPLNPMRRSKLGSIIVRQFADNSQCLRIAVRTEEANSRVGQTKATGKICR